MSMEVDFLGLEDIMDSLEGIVDKSKMKQALKEACMLVEREAKIKAPKEDGNLRRSITSDVYGLTGTVYTPLEYAPYVEYGTGLFSIHEMGGRTAVPWIYKDDKTGEFIATSGQHPQPYMFPALNENREEILRILREGITKK